MIRQVAYKLKNYEKPELLFFLGFFMFFAAFFACFGNFESSKNQISVPRKYAPYKKYNRMTKYDPHFRKYSKRFFGADFDYRIFKAQAIAESRLKENAVSHVGAKGIMQIMPSTLEEIKKENLLISSVISDPRWSIAAGIYYNRKLWDDWRAERSFQDRVDFTMASYNAGKRNILKAQRIARKRGKNGNLWKEIEKTLYKVTRGHSRQTIEYVRKIKEIRKLLERR